jgi:hypothetical protein
MALASIHQAPAPAPKARREISGAVLDMQGQPIRGALVYITPPAASVSILGGPPPFAWSASDYRTAISGPDGRFVIEYTRTPFNLRAEAPPLAPAEILNVTPGAPVALHLAAGLNHSGRVFHALIGEPVAGVEVMANEVNLRTPPGALEARRSTAVTDREGRFTLRGLRPRPHNVGLKSEFFALASASPPCLPGAKEVVLTARPAAAWKGTVTKASGQPIAGASVSLSTSFQGSGPSTRTDALGRFSLAVSPGRYTATVTHGDFAPASIEGLTAIPGSPENLAIQMSEGATARGRIVDHEGRPLKGKVRLRLFGRAPVLFGSQDLGTATNAAARFSFPHLPSGQHEIDVMAAGRTTAIVPVLVGAPSGSVDLGDILLEEGLAIAGRVVNEAGDPVRGARVTANASREASRSQPFETESEEDGRFMISGISEGRYLVSATAEGYSNLDDQRAGSGESNLKLTLRRAGSVRVRVVVNDSTGTSVRPVNDPVVLVGQHLERGVPRLPNRVEKVPSPSGEVAFENLIIGRQTVEIAATGYVPKSLGTVNVEPGKVIDLGEIRLERGFAVRGAVVDSSGRPVRGADVELSTKESNRMFLRRAVSDADGRFEITGVQPGNVDIDVSHQAYASGRETTTIGPEGLSPDVLVELRVGGRITGTVKRRDGDAVPGVLVRYNRVGGSFGWFRSQAETDAAGAFALENVAPGGTSVSVLRGQAGRFEPAMGKNVEVREGEESKVDFVLRETVVRGRVSGPAARANLRVRFVPAGFSGGFYGGGTSGSSLLSTIPRGSALTGADGSFELLIDQPGRYSADVTSYDTSENLIRRQIDVPDVDVFPLDFAAGASRVVVTVLDEATRSPLADAFVSAVPTERPVGPSSSPGSGTTGTDGRAVLYISDGEYRIGAQSTAYVPASVSTSVRGDDELTLTLATGLKITGRVRGAAGVVPPGYYVTAGLIGGGSPRAAMRTPGGGFEVTGLRPGRYRIHASAADDFGEAEAEAGAENVEIVLRPGGTISVLVVDAANQPAVHAGVAFSNDRGEPLSGIIYYTDNAGRLSMPMPAQTVNVNVSQQGLAGKGSVTLAPGETAEVRVVLMPRAGK